MLSSGWVGSSSTVGGGGCGARGEVAVSVYSGGGDVGNAVVFDSSAIFDMSRLCWSSMTGEVCRWFIRGIEWWDLLAIVD